jgi:hypothetical protein
VQVGAKAICVFGIVTDDHDYREEREVTVVQGSGESFLVDDGKGLMGRAWVEPSTGNLRSVVTAVYDNITPRTRESAAKNLHFQLNS